MSSRRIGRGFLGLFLCGKALAAAPDPHVEGRVVLDDGRPVAGAHVRLFDPADPSRSHGATADEWGRFSLALPGAAGTSSLPRRTTLLQNYPNPFNPSTVIPYQLSTQAHVRLEVFNVLGQLVATLVDQEVSAGVYTAIWRGTDGAGRAVAAGLYFYRLRGGDLSETRRMVLVDGQAGVPGPASAITAPTPESAPVSILTVSGPGVATHVDPDFRAGTGQVEIVVEARAGSGSRAKAAAGGGILGDVDGNGRVDLIDAVLVWLYAFDATITSPNDGDISLGDVDRDGRIDMTDFHYIVAHYVDPADPSLPEGIGDPVAAVLEGMMYWVDWETGKIQRANLDGSGIEDLVTDIYYVWSLALDVAEGRMYWTNASHRGPRIQRAHLDGSGVEDLITTGLFLIAGLTLDLPGGKMYWTDSGTRRIQRANLDGSRVEDLLTTNLYGPRGLALDLTRGKMYWGDWGSGRLQRSNLDGTQVEELLSRGNPDNLVLVIPEGKIYWMESASGEGDGELLRANLDGSEVQDFPITGVRQPRGLVLHLPGLPEADVNRPPVLEGIVKQSVVEGETLRIDLFGRDPEGGEVAYEALSDGGVAMVSVSGSQLTIHPAAPGRATVTVKASDAEGNTTSRTFSVRVTAPLPVSLGRMYWTDWEVDKIQRANLDGSRVEELVTTGLAFPYGLALDVAGGKMYWADAGTQKIQRANLDGSRVEDLVTSETFEPIDVALDVVGGKMYWTATDYAWTASDYALTWGAILRANLDGSQIEEVLTTAGIPEGIALDLVAGKMYWTDTARSNLGRANLDGSQAETIVGWGSDIGPLNIPLGLALDRAGGKIYWQDPGTLRMQRANLDGSQAEDLHVSGLGYPGIGLALDPAEGKIYWTDGGRKQILRSNLDGTRVEDLLSGLGGPAGLALEILAPDLVASDPWASPRDLGLGQSFTLSVAIRNRGQLPAPATTIRYYVSNDATITRDDTEVGTRPVRGLSAPGTSFKLIRLRAPSSPGDYYYGACVDPPAGEAETRNNCSPAVRVRVGG